MSEHDAAPPPMDADLHALLRRTKTSFDAEANLHLDRAFDRPCASCPTSGQRMQISRRRTSVAPRGRAARPQRWV